MILFENREKYTDYATVLSRVYKFIQFIGFFVKHLFGGMRARGGGMRAQGERYIEIICSLKVWEELAL